MNLRVRLLTGCQRKEDSRRGDLTEELLATLEEFIPAYIVNPERDNLKKMLVDHFPNFSNPDFVYTQIENSDILQGDCIDEIPFFKIGYLDEDNKVPISYQPAILISNSCSANLLNPKLFPVNLNFAGVIQLSKYIDFLKSKKIDEARIENHILELKSNLIHNFIYLPTLLNKETEKILFPESLIKLDSISTLPINKLENYHLDYKPNGDRYFTLSNYGLYVFIIKLSTFFCRFSENLNRGSLNV